MNEPAYPFNVSDDALDYQFESVSGQQVINKLVQFRPFPSNAIFYNMALLDVSSDGTVDDSVVSNNQDMPKVLARVVGALLLFFERYPYKLVHFKGSDAEGVRTRLYRIIIARELDKASTLFHVYGKLSDEVFEDFVKNRPYIAFIIQKK